MKPLAATGAYLFDTNVLSATRQSKEEPLVLALVASLPVEAQFVSVLTLGELWRGFTLKHRQSPHGAMALARWIDRVESDFDGRILPLDLRTVKTWGDIAPDRSQSVIDTLLAATAIVHGMTLVTRNVSHFQDLPLKLLNPWDR